MMTMLMPAHFSPGDDDLDEQRKPITRCNQINENGLSFRHEWQTLGQTRARCANTYHKMCDVVRQIW